MARRGNETGNGDADEHEHEHEREDADAHEHEREDADAHEHEHEDEDADEDADEPDDADEHADEDEDADEHADEDEDEPEDEDADEHEHEHEDGEEAETVAEWLGGRRLPKRSHLVVGLVLPAALALINMWRASPHTVDDAFISYRYARNLARGLGLVYNAGEHIEGYTNFLWTVLLAGGIKLGLDPELLAKVLGAGFALGTLGMVYLLGARIRPLTVAPCLTTWLLASTMTFAGYAVFGLETAMFGFLVLAGSWMMLREEDRGAGVPYSGLVFAAAGLTRPEAPLFIGVLMMFLQGRGLLPADRWLRARAGDGATDSSPGPDEERPVLLFGALAVAVGLVALRLSLQRPSTVLVAAGGLVAAGALAVVVAVLPRAMFSRRNLARSALFVAPVAAHMLWRHGYYGSWLPNTLGAKTGNLWQQVHGGSDYFEKFIGHEGPVLYLALLGLAAALAWRNRELLAMGAIVALWSVYVVVVGGDWMPHYRFMVPALPFAFLLVDVGVRAALEQRWKVANYGLLLFALLVAGHRARRLGGDAKRIIRDEKGFWDRAAGGVARWFDEQARARGREQVRGAIAIGDIGQVGYQTDFPILDLLGLVDPVIAKLPGGYTTKVGKGFRERFFDVAPRYMILISSDRDCRHPSVIGSRVLWRDARFRRQYVRRGQVTLDKGFSWCIYENRRSVPEDVQRQQDAGRHRPRGQRPRLRIPPPRR